MPVPVYVRGSRKRRLLSLGVALTALAIVSALTGEVARAQSASSTATEADVAAEGAFQRCMPAYNAGDNLKLAACARELADKGNAFAQFMLGLFYVNGEGGLAPDPKQGAAWLRKSADQGYPAAEYNLGALYWHGKGVPRDLHLSNVWMQKAADSGDPDAQKWLKSQSANRATPRSQPAKSFGDLSPDELTELNRRQFNESWGKPLEVIQGMMKRMCEQRGEADCSRFTQRFQR